jgi:tetratricopeptide (TPR) repeat protein
MSDALDESREELAREAAMLLSVAEGHLSDEAADEAERAASEALKLFRELGDRKAVADTLRILIRVRRVKGDLMAAEQMAKDELERCEEREDVFGEAAMLLTLVECASDIFALNDLTEDRLVSTAAACQTAIKYGKDAQGIFRDLGEEKMEALSLLAMAGVYRDMSMPKETMQTANDALVLYRSLKDKKGEAMALHAVAMAYGMVEKWLDAMKLSKMARSLFQELGLQSLEATALYFTGQWYLLMEDYSQMLQDEQEAMELFASMDNIKGEAAAFKLVVSAQFLNNDEEAVLELAESKLKTFKNKGSAKGEAAALDALAKVYDTKGDKDTALQMATDALGVIRELGDSKWESMVLNGVAMMQFEAGKYGEANESIDKAIAIFTQMGDNASKAAAILQVKAEVAAATNNFEQALGSLGEADQIYQGLGDKKGQAMTYFSYGSLLHKINQVDAAENYTKQAQALFEELGDNMNLIYALHLLTQILIVKKLPEDATKTIHEVHLITQKEKDKVLEANALIFMVQAHFAVMGKLADEGGSRESRVFSDALNKAEKAATGALKLSEKLEDADLKANATYTLAEVNFIGQNFNDALQGAEEAEKLYTESEGKAGQASAVLLKGQVFQFLGRIEDSINATTEALALAQEIGDMQLAGLAQERLDKLQGTRMMQMGGFGMPMQEAAPVQEAAPEVSSAIVEEKPKGLDALIVGDMLHGMLREMVGVQMESDTPFMDAGVDSLMSIEFRSQVNQAFSGLALASTLTFDYPTIRELTAHIVEKSENQ